MAPTSSLSSGSFAAAVLTRQPHSVGFFYQAFLLFDNLLKLIEEGAVVPAGVLCLLVQGSLWLRVMKTPWSSHGGEASHFPWHVSPKLSRSYWLELESCEFSSGGTSYHGQPFLPVALSSILGLLMQHHFVLLEPKMPILQLNFRGEAGNDVIIV